MDELQAHIAKINNLIREDKIDRAILSTVHADIARRIFKEGKSANGGYIGTYSPGYQKIRRKNNWPPSSKVILQATRQMVNDFSLIRVRKNHFGSGFKNNKNGEKRLKMEAKYKKPIFALTMEESASIQKYYLDAVKRYIS